MEALSSRLAAVLRTTWHTCKCLQTGEAADHRLAVLEDLVLQDSATGFTADLSVQWQSFSTAEVSKALDPDMISKRELPGAKDQAMPSVDNSFGMAYDEAFWGCHHGNSMPQLLIPPS